MKLTSFAVPVLIVSLTTVAVYGAGMLTVRASAASTRTSIQLLRMQMEVTRLHEQLLERSREGLAVRKEALQRNVPKATGANPVQPWPEEAGTLKGRGE